MFLTMILMMGRATAKWFPVRQLSLVILQHEQPQQTIIQDTIQVRVQRNIITQNAQSGQQLQYSITPQPGKIKT